MLKKHFIFLMMLFGFAGFISCSHLKKRFIQSKLSEVTGDRAKKVTYIPPPLPYKPEHSQKLDKLWRNTEDQSSISYFSSCSKTNRELNFYEIQEDILSGTPHRKLLDTESSPSFLRSRFQIRGTNYKTINSIHIFKNKTCFFVLNFVAGSQAVFKKNEPLFLNFINEFKAL